MRFLLIGIACSIVVAFAHVGVHTNVVTPLEWVLPWIRNMSVMIAVIAVVCGTCKDNEGVNNYLWGTVTRTMAKMGWYMGIVATLLCLTIYAVGTVPGVLFVPFPAILTLMIAAWMTEQVYNGGLVY